MQYNPPTTEGVFSIYDQRIEMFGQKGMVLGQKGQAMLSLKQDKEKIV